MTRPPVQLTQKEFNSLNNYSCSNPTRLSIGKTWKRAKNYSQQTDDVQDWMHCRVVADPNGQKDYVGIELREIELPNLRINNNENISNSINCTFR